MAADHHNDDLDELLDSALDDFHNLNLNNVQRRGGGGEEEEGRTLSGVQGLGLGLGLPDLKSKKKKGKQREKAPKKEKEKEKEKESHVSEALDQLRAQTREAVKGLESVTATSNPNADDAIMEDWVKQFEELAGSQGVEFIMETMMQQLLSKEILHEPMKEIGERYPKWLAEHASSLSKEEYERFSHQYKLIKDLNEVYEKEPSNFNKIVEFMQKMQECGQPPSDILHELAPDFDLASLGQISPEMLESQENCCIM